MTLTPEQEQAIIGWSLKFYKLGYEEAVRNMRKLTPLVPPGKIKRMEEYTKDILRSEIS